eukprot:2978109-Amphidinium_carterae.1
MWAVVEYVSRKCMVKHGHKRDALGGVMLCQGQFELTATRTTNVTFLANRVAHVSLWLNTAVSHASSALLERYV